jgi:uncharacterized protein (TIRG00374 family)
MPEKPPDPGAGPLTGRSLRRFEYWAVGGIVAFAVALALLSIWAGAGTVLQPMRRLSAGLVAGLLALSLLNYLLRALRWQRFADGLGVHVPWRRNLLFFFAGFATTTTPGKTGEVLRLWMIERSEGHAYERTAPLFLGDRLCDMAAIMLFCLLSVGAFAGYAGATVAAAGLLLLLTLPFLHPRLLALARRWLGRAMSRRFPNLHRRIDIAIGETARLFTFRILGIALLLSLAGWLAEIYEFQLLLDAMGAPLSLQQVSFIFSFAMTAGAVSMLPGGLGGTEAVMLALLSAAGIEFGTAVAATAIIRLTTLWFATLLGVVALPFAMRAARLQPGRTVEAAR